MFDEVLCGATGEELVCFALSLPHRAGAPALVVKELDGAAAMAERVGRLLGERGKTAPPAIFSKRWDSSGA